MSGILKFLPKKTTQIVSCFTGAQCRVAINYELNRAEHMEKQMPFFAPKIGS